MNIIKEFKEFAIRGNVVDLAVGVIIGSAFGKIVSSLVSDVVMPPIGFLLGGVNFTDLKVVIKQASVSSTGKVTDAVTLNYGNFIQTVFDFAIIAFTIFLIIQIVNKLKRHEEKKTETKEAKVTKEQELLAEIRDILKQEGKRVKSKE